MKKPAAEFIGTFTLVFIGCGAAAIAGPSLGILGVAFAFGLTYTAMSYGVGPISGCHLNPAVSFGFLMAGRLSPGACAVYAVAQILGALAGAGLLYLVLSGKGAGWTGALGQNGWGSGFAGGYDLLSAFVFEAVAAFAFLVAFLGATRGDAPPHHAGLVIGLALTGLYIVGINITGGSINPARSLGPAIVGVGDNPKALIQVWLFVTAPLVGATMAGMLFSLGLLGTSRS